VRSGAHWEDFVEDELFPSLPCSPEGEGVWAEPRWERMWVQLKGAMMVGLTVYLPGMEEEQLGWAFA
jgi:hypothetical protein